jgi:hypothetical protein
MSPEIAAKMPIWRARAARGELTEAEVFEAMAAYRAGRQTASEQTVAKRSARAKAEVPSADDMLAKMRLAAKAVG